MGSKTDLRQIETGWDKYEQGGFFAKKSPACSAYRLANRAFPCGRRDLNSHDLAITGTWSLRVCLFRHFREQWIFQLTNSIISIQRPAVNHFYHFYSHALAVSETPAEQSHIHGPAWISTPLRPRNDGRQSVILRNRSNEKRAIASPSDSSSQSAIEIIQNIRQNFIYFIILDLAGTGVFVSAAAIFEHQASDIDIACFV